MRIDLSDDQIIVTRERTDRFPCALSWWNGVRCRMPQPAELIARNNRRPSSGNEPYLQSGTRRWYRANAIPLEQEWATGKVVLRCT